MYPTIRPKYILFRSTSRRLPKWWPTMALEPIIERHPYEGWNMLFWLWLYTWVALGRTLGLAKRIKKGD